MHEHCVHMYTSPMGECMQNISEKAQTDKLILPSVLKKIKPSFIPISYGSKPYIIQFQLL